MMYKRAAVALALVFGGCSAPESGTTLTNFEGSVDVLNQRMDVVYRSPSGAFQSAVTLPYGTAAGDVYFHTCPGTIAFNAASHILTASVQAVNLQSGPVGSLNAIIDSTSPSSVTPTGIIAMYGSVAPNSADCAPATSTTWQFNDPTNANFTFKGHADGIPVVPPPVTTTGVFTGAAPGQGLDFAGTFVYAVSVDTPGGYTIGNATFTADNAPGVTLTAQNNIPNWHPASNFGGGADNANLAKAITGIRWSNAPAAVNLTLANLTVGKAYKLQLLFAESCCNRGFNVTIQGTQVASQFSPKTLQGGTNVTTNGAFLTYQYTAASTTLNVVLQGPAPMYTDNNPILNAFTLKALP